MSVIALSPVGVEPTSPMITSVTGTPSDPLEEPASPGHTPCRQRRAPPLHAGADWKVLLHLPEVQTWLRATGGRVSQLTHSASQDTQHRHIDTHLLQLKDICEDISDHVEQIHALLETEFSLKLLSYSVNIIVDIRSVQLLWHQLRVSVLVLKERLLQGLQDSNGNFTRQTDILQAFTQDQTRVDELTEVDDCGRLTIRCSQDYFSLDCGITAFELSDYSPGETPQTQDLHHLQDPSLGPDPETQTQDLHHLQDPSLGPDPETQTQTQLETQSSNTPTHSSNSTHCAPNMHCGTSHQTEASMSKRPLPVGAASPTQPSLAKRAALVPDPSPGAGEGTGRPPPTACPTPGLLSRGEESPTGPSLPEPQHRGRFWLELDSVYPESTAHLQTPDLLSAQTPTSSQSRLETRTPSRGQSDSPLPADSPIQSPGGEALSSSYSGEESDPRAPASQLTQRPVQHVKGRDHWFGSEEFLALPDQLRQTELLAINLESLTKVLPLRSGGDLDQQGLQDIDDWDLSEPSPDCYVHPAGDSSDDAPYRRLKHRHFNAGRFSPASSSDVPPSLDESIESGPLSDLLSEEEEGRSSGSSAPPVDGQGTAVLLTQLLEGIQHQEQDPHILKKIEGFVTRLDVFIEWLKDALLSTDNWTPPRHTLDHLRDYLDTHLSFKVNVDDHRGLKESIVEEGRLLLTLLTTHQAGLRDILQMVCGQWEELQKQIRRQHSWMLGALRTVLHQSHDPSLAGQGPPANQKAPCPNDSLKENTLDQRIQRGALEHLASTLNSLHYGPATPQHTHTDSLQDFEANYQELWDWLMDMEAMVTESHQLMMSEEQKGHLFKGLQQDVTQMQSRTSSLLGRAEFLSRSPVPLPSDFHLKIHTLTQRWSQLENMISENAGHGSSRAPKAGLGSSDLLGVGGDGDQTSSLSPLSRTLLDQLEVRIKDLKSWLRDTELLIFNSCLRTDQSASVQLPSFKSLCEEVRGRRRAVSSVLRLCQKLLQQSQIGPLDEVGPDAEQHREALQLLSINLERRWEAVVMQSLQWRNRLARELQEEQEEAQVTVNFLDQDLGGLDLVRSSLVSPAPGDLVRSGLVSPAPAGPDDSWEWDEMDMSMAGPEPQDLTGQPPHLLAPPGPRSGCQRGVPSPNPTGSASDPFSQSECPGASTWVTPPSNRVYQVYSVHSVELSAPPPLHLLHHPATSSKTTTGPRKHQTILKTLSKDSSFSSFESLPDLLGAGGGGGERGGDRSSRRSESESGIVSDTGDQEVQGEEEQEEENEERKERNEEGEVQGGDYGRRSDCCVLLLHNGEGESKWSKKMEKGGESRRLRDKVKVEKKSEWRRGALEEEMEMLGDPAPSHPWTSTLGHLRDDGHRAGGSSLGSSSSSLDSLLALGLELFPCSSRDLLQRSASLESCLAPCLSPGGGHIKEEEIDEEEEEEEVLGDTSSGELSRRTLDLLKRLEEIQTPTAPLELGMTRSMSDMSMRSCSPQLRRLATSSSLSGGRRSGLSVVGTSFRRPPPPSFIAESSAASSTEDFSSLGSEDSRGARSGLLLPEPAGGARKRRRGNGRRGPPGDDLSMEVNVSCTDEDEDEGDLLSSSTLTEEGGGGGGEQRAEGEEGGRSGVSSGDEEEVEMEGCEYMKKELQNWMRPPPRLSFTCSSSRCEVDLQDELQCGSSSASSDTSSDPNSSCTVTSNPLLSHSAQTDSSNTTESSERGERVEEEEEEENRKNTRRSYLRQLVDDVENGNVERSRLPRGEEDLLLLREEAGLFIQKAEAFRFQSSLFGPTGGPLGDTAHVTGDSQAVVSETEVLPSPGCHLLPFSSKQTSLVGQLHGELPCQSPSHPSPPSLSPIEDSSSQDALRPAAARGRRSLTIQERFAFSSLVTEESRREVRDKESSLTPKRPHRSHCSCSPFITQSLCPSKEKREEVGVEEREERENVHDFVMEIIHMTSHALRGKGTAVQNIEKNTEQVQNIEKNIEKVQNIEKNTDKVQNIEKNIEKVQNIEKNIEKVHNIELNIEQIIEPVHNIEQIMSEGGELYKTKQNPELLSQIREKVLEHSHRPLLLRRGDFYSYLSLSSHDSDCGEVTACTEDKSAAPAAYSIPCYSTPGPALSPAPYSIPCYSTPGPAHSPAPYSIPCYSTPGPAHSPSATKPSALHLQLDGPTCTCDDRYTNEPRPLVSSSPGPDIRDKEVLFPACTEEVYLGPPLCYSVGVPGRRQQEEEAGQGSLSPLHPYTSLSQRSSCSSPEAPGPTPALRFPAPPAECGRRRGGRVLPGAPPPRVPGSVEEEQGGERGESQEPPYLNPWRPADGSQTGGVMTGRSTPHPRPPPAGGDAHTPQEEEQWRGETASQLELRETPQSSVVMGGHHSRLQL